MMETIKGRWEKTGRRPERFTFSLWSNAFIGNREEIKEQKAVHEKFGSVAAGMGRDQLDLAFQGESRSRWED